jgi:acetyltransferase-like isoleucine patch superfamily enzyme
MPIIDCNIHPTAKIPYPDLVNLYGATVGENSFVGPFVEIQRGAIVGKNTRIQSHSFVCEGVTIGDNVFISHGVMFINDTWPRSGAKWKLKYTTVKDGASIGTNATILPVRIGYGSMVGAGSVVTRDVRDYTLVVGNPSRTIRFLGNK